MPSCWPVPSTFAAWDNSSSPASFLPKSSGSFRDVLIRRRSSRQFPTGAGSARFHRLAERILFFPHRRRSALVRKKGFTKEARHDEGAGRLCWHRPFPCRHGPALVELRPHGSVGGAISEAEWLSWICPPLPAPILPSKASWSSPSAGPKPRPASRIPSFPAWRSRGSPCVAASNSTRRWSTMRAMGSRRTRNVRYKPPLRQRVDVQSRDWELRQPPQQQHGSHEGR